MAHRRLAIRVLTMLLFGIALVLPAQAATARHGSGFICWRAAEGGFAGWQRVGTMLGDDGILCLEPSTAQPASDPYPAGGYYGHSFYNGGSFFVGEATSPAIPAAFDSSEAIASWNAETPAGTWIETLISAQVGGAWTKWYNLGIWAADSSTIERHSVQLQGDADGDVAVDTLVLSGKRGPATAFQIKLRLFSADGEATPVVRNASVAFSTAAPKAKAPTPGAPALWNRRLAVPACSQMVYPDGGNVWCSPTSTSMVVAYWDRDRGACEPRVRAAVAGTYDWLYDGAGNWPFNTAYAATHKGLQAYVARFSGFDQAEQWIKAGVPVIISYAWKKGTLTGAPIASSDGHLAVLVGFDAAGNPILNDPAAPGDDTVQRTYDRAELEANWLETSGGAVYLIYPEGWAVPPLG